MAQLARRKYGGQPRPSAVSPGGFSVGFRSGGGSSGIIGGGGGFSGGGGDDSSWQRVLPPSWLLLTACGVYTLAESASEVTTADLPDLMRRCRHHVGAASAHGGLGQTGREALTELAEWIEAVAAVGSEEAVSPLPFLVRLGLLPLLRLGLASGDAETRVACCDLLGAACANRAFAAIAARDDELVGLLIAEMLRHVESAASFTWTFDGTGGAFRLAPARGTGELEPAAGSDDADCADADVRAATARSGAAATGTGAAAGMASDEEHIMPLGELTGAMLALAALTPVLRAKLRLAPSGLSSCIAQQQSTAGSSGDGGGTVDPFFGGSSRGFGGSSSLGLPTAASGPAKLDPRAVAALTALLYVARRAADAGHIHVAAPDGAFLATIAALESPGNSNGGGGSASTAAGGRGNVPSVLAAGSAETETALMKMRQEALATLDSLHNLERFLTELLAVLSEDQPSQAATVTSAAVTSFSASRTGVELLLDRRTVAELAELSWSPEPDVARPATIAVKNVAAAYRTRRSITAAVGATGSADVAPRGSRGDSSSRSSSENRSSSSSEGAVQQASPAPPIPPASPLRPDDDTDAAWLEQVAASASPVAPWSSGAYQALALSSTAAAAGAVWGAARRVASYHRSGEGFAAGIGRTPGAGMSGGSGASGGRGASPPPRLLSLASRAGGRAAVGATILAAAYGPSGVRAWIDRHLLPLPSKSGSGGSGGSGGGGGWEDNAAGKPSLLSRPVKAAAVGVAADAVFTYAVVRLFPYAVMPFLAVLCIAEAEEAID